MEDPDTEGLVAPPPENLLPSPWLEKKDFRLTRDWSKFPSAGLLSHPVSDVSQAQYGAVADTIFESMKVCLETLMISGLCANYGKRSR